jgi:hypothetical protein
VSILALNATTFGEDYKAAQHPLAKYRKDVQQVLSHFTGTKALALLVLKYFGEDYKAAQHPRCQVPKGREQVLSTSKACTLVLVKQVSTFRGL